MLCNQPAWQWQGIHHGGTVFRLFSCLGRGCAAMRRSSVRADASEPAINRLMDALFAYGGLFLAALLGRKRNDRLERISISPAHSRMT